MKPDRKAWYKISLALLAAVLLLAVHGFQASLNTMRADPELQLSRVAPLENAPPVLAFTTVALGGFRGLIANVLWIRANNLQMEGKYFEMVQLADWITKLEPHFTQVWLMQAWNMAYNISVKFNDPPDRWRWVQRGIELLRDQGLRYNPKEALIYRELGWFFQHKMGQNMDSAHYYYKARWAEDMESLLGGPQPDFDALLQPRTAADTNRLQRLRQVYRMDPAIMQDVNRDYGPLDWRLPETHAIYWAVVGLRESRPKDLITLRRVIYQSMDLATIRGRLTFIDTADGRTIRLSPNLNLAERANAAFERLIQDDEEMRHAIQIAHRSFLRELIFLLYSYNRIGEAQRWLDYTRRLYPDAIEPNLNAEQYALNRLTGSIRDLSVDQTAAFIEGLLVQSFYSEAIGEDDRAEGLRLMARQMWQYHRIKVGDQQDRIGLPPLEEMSRTVRDRLLAPDGMDPLLQARLRTRLGLPAPTPTPTNAPPAQPNR